MAAVPGDLVMPGDVILVDRGEDIVPVLGIGLRVENDVVYAVNPGILKKREKSNTYWVESRKKRVGY